MIPSPTPSPTPTPITEPDSENELNSPKSPDHSSEEISTSGSITGDEADRRPLIIGIIVASVVLVTGLYLVLIELPHRKKLKEYRRRHGR